MTRRLLLAVLATLAPAVAASPAGAAGHTNVGIVDIYTTLGYQHGAAAGTGIIVSRSGEILTNNHVIAGATKFKVVDVATQRTYRAAVAGYSVSRDVAVLQLAHASGLRTVSLGGGVRVRVGQRVFARGNAQGRGGAPKVARGQVIALHQQILAQDETGDSETLNDMIATNAAVVPGYSGGPLEDGLNRVLGIVTAGSTTGVHRGFAIPIRQALLLARKIESGKSSATVHVGPTAFLGVELPNGTKVAKIAKVLPHRAAAAAGLVAGDVITSLGSSAISSPADLRQAVLLLVPGKSVAIGWTDANNIAQTGTITPTSGPPQ